MSAYTNVKVTIRNPKTGEEHMTHVPVRSEITYPGSGKVIYIVDDSFNKIMTLHNHQSHSSTGYL